MENMSDKQPKEVQEVEVNETTIPDQKRRALSKAVLTAPILGALASKPALGAAQTCSVSVLMSGNTSIDIDLTSCGGCSPGFWFNHKKECYLPDTITGSTTFGAVFNKGTIASPVSLYDHILNVLSGWQLRVFNDNDKDAFVAAVATSMNTMLTEAEKIIVHAIFQFCRGLMCAWLNAKTIGLIFPTLITTGALHSTTQLQTMADNLYANALDYYTSGSMSVDKDNVYDDWDNSKEVSCSMFGSCPKDTWGQR